MRQIRLHYPRYQGFVGPLQFLIVDTENRFAYAFGYQQRVDATGLGGEQADDTAACGRDGEVDVLGFDGSARVEDCSEKRFPRTGDERCKVRPTSCPTPPCL